MTMNGSSGIIDTVTNTRNYVDFIFSNSGQAGHNTTQSISAFTYNWGYRLQTLRHTHTQATVCEHSKEVFGKYISVTDVNFSSINQNSSELSYIKSQTCRFYHNKLVSALKHPNWRTQEVTQMLVWRCELTGRKLHSSQRLHTVDCHLKKPKQ